MESNKCRKNAGMFHCKKCNFTCSKQSNFMKHTLTVKHKMESMETHKMRENALRLLLCDCGKEYACRSGLWKHKKICGIINKNNETVENPIISTDDVDYKSMFLKAIQQNNELMNVIMSQAEKSEEMMTVLKDIIPKIGNNNITTTNNNNNQFNLQVFLNEDCKDAVNFSEFIKGIQVSFADLENQAENGYIKGISKLFIENLQSLGVNKRPIHCTDKKRKTLYIKENDEWDKEGSLETLTKGIQEISRRTFEELIKSKEVNAEEYKDNESEFSNKCVSIQRNLVPNYPRETTIGKVIEIISKTSTIDEK
jgi:hypothetical protein